MFLIVSALVQVLTRADCWSIRHRPAGMTSRTPVRSPSPTDTSSLAGRPSGANRSPFSTTTPKSPRPDCNSLTATTVYTPLATGSSVKVPSDLAGAKTGGMGPPTMSRTDEDNVTVAGLTGVPFTSTTTPETEYARPGPMVKSTPRIDSFAATWMTLAASGSGVPG